MCNVKCFVSLLIFLLYSCEAAGPEPRVVGGRPARENEVPYQVSLRLRRGEKSFGRGHICGGTLISNRTVLSAAHCFYDNKFRQIQDSEFVVVMGILQRTNITNAVSALVEKVIIHEKFNLVSMQNDIALMILKKEIDLKALYPRVQAVDLVDEELPVGTYCRVSGWGKLRDGSGFTPDDLFVVDVPLMDFQECDMMNRYLLKRGMVCAGFVRGGKDACKGDSGGPLAYLNATELKYRLAGVVSWGEGCAEYGKPGVYTDVFQFREWIAKASSSCRSINYLLILVSLIIFYIKDKLL